MKFLAIFLTASMFVSQSFAAETKLEGIYDSNAAIITEALLAAAKYNQDITVDTSIYTVTSVSSIDATGSTIECKKFQFGGTPARYECSVQTAE